MRLPSVSSLERAEKCPASEALPHVRTIRRDAEKGSVKHRYLARVPEVGAEAALAEVSEEYRDECAAIDLSRLPACEPGSYAAEVAFAFNVQTGKARELGRGLTREAAYSQIGEWDIPGTVDNVGLVGADGVVVTDYKSGWAGHVAPAKDNLQLGAYALFAARAYGRSRAVVIIWRVCDDGTVWPDRAELDAFALDAIEARIVNIVAGVLSERRMLSSLLTEGDHCRWCPALPACPAKTGMALALGGYELRGDALGVITAASAPKIWGRLKMAKLVIAEVQKAIEAYAEVTPFTLSDGSIVGPVEETRESLKAPVALKVLEQRFGPEVAKVACELDTSKAAIKRALQPYAQEKGLKITKLMDSTLEQIRQAGGISKKTSRPVREYEEKKELAQPADCAQPPQAAAS